MRRIGVELRGHRYGPSQAHFKNIYNYVRLRRPLEAAEIGLPAQGKQSVIAMHIIIHHAQSAKCKENLER